MTDPLTFINARLDEAEATAKAAPLETWYDSRTGTRILHVAALDPRAVLADVAAKRKILALHELFSKGYLKCSFCSDGHEELLDWPCPTVRALASAWAWHPDWREEWGE